jgi:chlorobactene glucosyltransferase
MQIVVSLGWMALVCWLICRAYGQRKLFPALESATPAIAETPCVSVIIPARNEQANLAGCLQSLVDQDYPPDRINIVVVDDNSSDDTFVLACAIARGLRRVNVVRCPALPLDWVGKPHACWIGAQKTRREDEWICFIDADVVAERHLIASAVAAARSRNLDLLSLAPRQRLGSFAERLIMPCGLYLLAFCQNLALLQSPGGDKVTASGQFMLVRRRTYESIGGHAAVRNAICEDVELARIMKAGGGAVLLLDGRSLLSARMYDGWRSLWAGLSKNLVEMLGGTAATICMIPLAALLPWMSIVLPTLDGVHCADGVSTSCVALLPAFLGTAAMFGLHMAGTSYFGIPFWYGLLFPLGYTVGACLAVESLRRRFKGTIVWKGRTYP